MERNKNLGGVERVPTGGESDITQGAVWKESWRAFPMLHLARDSVLAQVLSQTRTNVHRSPLTGNCHISTNHLSS